MRQLTHDLSCDGQTADSRIKHTDCCRVPVFIFHDIKSPFMNAPPYFTIVPSWTCIFKRFYVETTLVYFAIKKVTCHKTDNFLFFIPILITEPTVSRSHTDNPESSLSFRVLHQYQSLHTLHVCNLQHGLSFLQAEDLRLLLP